ncbi:hypothetical protein NXH76_29035 [Blautia schinkii]|nr:hypothetical protein [Blautia schinkii]
MTREESLAYRQGCPYDAMGDYSVFIESGLKIEQQTHSSESSSDICPAGTKENLRYI